MGADQAAGAEAAFLLFLGAFVAGFFPAPEPFMVEVLAIGAEPAAAGAEGAARAPMLKAEAMTAAMRVFK